jgi:hypothetical protein
VADPRKWKVATLELSCHEAGAALFLDKYTHYNPGAEKSYFKSLKLETT